MASESHPISRADDVAAIYDQFAPRLYAVAVRLLGVREEAEECVQDLFVALVRSRTDRVEITDLRAYLFSALRHAVGQRANAHGRREQLHAVLERTGEPQSAAPDEGASRALQSLPEEQREVVALKIDGQLTFAEIAETMGTSLNTAASRYRYALERLRAQLGEVA